MSKSTTWQTKNRSRAVFCLDFYWQSVEDETLAATPFEAPLDPTHQCVLDPSATFRGADADHAEVSAKHAPAPPPVDVAEAHMPTNVGFEQRLVYAFEFPS